MAGTFAFLWLASLVCLMWSMVRPGHFARRLSSRRLTRKHLGLGFGSLMVLFFVLVGATAPPQPGSSQKVSLSSTVQKADTTSASTTKRLTQTKTIAFNTTQQSDATLPKGQAKVLQTGQNGTETLTYNVTYTNGVESGRTLISDVTTTPAVAQIVAVGTYVAPAPAALLVQMPTDPIKPTNCTNGTYVNTAGNSVCSPESAPTAPAGATALCNDGVYNFSQMHSGTCSRHRGVAKWL